MYAKVLHRKVRICFGRILPILARCQDAATVYVSGVDVIDGSAVLDIKPYHPVDSVAKTEDLRFANWLPEPRASAEVTWSGQALDELLSLQKLCQFYPDSRDQCLEELLLFLRTSIEEVIGGLTPQSRQSKKENSNYWVMDFDSLSVVFRSEGRRLLRLCEYKAGSAKDCQRSGCRS
ncbi:unnamed protein product [Durusdinium trenchii]|uniref:TsaA-like domain-containing protein n=1 Tax=Durusdinium trenchii TaxID=1381693 RepID=A0ABP0STI6_9DINO